MKQHLPILLALFSLWPASLCAQSAARLTGNVSDTSGKPVAKVQLTAVGARVGSKAQATTGEDGGFMFPPLDPDTYEVLATAPDFSDYTTSVALGTGQTRTLEITLNSAAEATKITIDERGTTMDQSSARIGMNVTAQELAQAPLNGRTYGQLALMAPGAANTGDGALDKLRFNGQSFNQNHFTYDGIDISGIFNTPPGWITVTGIRFHLQIGVDSIDEFRVDSALYPAEAGTGTGAQIATVSRPGSSEWHGSFFEFLRNDNLLTARNYFDSTGRSKLRMNQFGGNAGGQILKNHLFVNGSFEGLRQSTRANILELVPSQSARARAVPTIAPVLNALPLGQSRTANPDLDSARREAPTALDETNFVGRLDYITSTGQRFYARYFKQNGEMLAPDYTVSPRNVHAVYKPDNLVLAWSGSVHGISNEVRAGLNRVPGTVYSYTGIPELEGLYFDFRGAVTGEAAMAGGISSPGGLSRQIGAGNTPSVDFRGKSYTALDNISIVRGSHTLKAGAEMRAIRVPFKTGGSTIFVFSTLNAFLVNRPTAAVYTGATDFHVGEQEYWNGYVQDEWRLRPNLTLNYGLRYEYYSPNRERDNRAKVFDVATLSYVDASHGFPKAEKKGFGPRLGLSWAPERWNGKTVLRVGGGIYNGPGQYMDVMAPLINDGLRLTVPGAAYPLNGAVIAANHLGIESPVGFDVNNYRMSERNMQFGMSIQQQLPFRFVGQAGYTGSLARNLYQRNIGNIATTVNTQLGAAMQRNPAWGEIEYRTSGGKSSYNAMQLGLTRRFVDGMTFGAAYTWSHGLGTSQGAGEAAIPQDPNCFACDKGDNPGDLRHVFSANAVYELPFGTGKSYFKDGVGARLLGHWTMGVAANAHSGLPVNVTLSMPSIEYIDPNTGRVIGVSGAMPAGAKAIVVPGARVSRRPDLLPGVDPYMHSGDPLQWLNPAAFANPAPGRVGTLGRNAFRGPGFSQFDLMLARRFSLGETRAIEFRAEAFNLLNHANFAAPFASLPVVLPVFQPGQPYSLATSAGFGALSQTLGRTVGLGTSRQAQVALRLSF